MSTNPIFLKTLLVTLVLSSPISAFANKLALKVAVIKGATGSSVL